jgi:pyruvate ferredoxin oxidoreductase gamma subunit/phenylglyoxylate dehydrogenase gamma subunit
MGTVKAAEIIVWAKVAEGGYGCSLPFFGFERKGAPVTAFVKLDESPIRPKTQVYDPDCVIVLDPTIQNALDVFEGMKKDAVFVLNTAEEVANVQVPETVRKVATVNATDIALDRLGRAVTNTAMLGAFVKCTGWVSLDEIAAKVEEYWGKENAALVEEAHDLTEIRELDGKV